MVDWNSPEEIALDAAAFTKVIFAFCGVYFWEFLISLDFDWSYISQKRKFRWPLIFYFADRYLFLTVCCALCVSQSITKEINCQPLFTFMQIGGNMAAGFASINLSVRTIAIWSQNKWVVGMLVLIILGHWSLILQGVLLNAQWVDGQGCVITHAQTTVLAAQFVYTMIFDLIVLVLTAWKLILPVGKRSRLVHVLFRDGLIYFIIAFVGNILVTVFELSALNPVMTIIFNFPAISLSTIAATRAVRNLARHIQPGAEIFTTKKPTTAASVVYARPAFTLGQDKSLANGVHVQMETFAAADYSQEDDSMKGKPGQVV